MTSPPGIANPSGPPPCPAGMGPKFSENPSAGTSAPFCVMRTENVTSNDSNSRPASRSGSLNDDAVL